MRHRCLLLFLLCCLTCSLSLVLAPSLDSRVWAATATSTPDAQTSKEDTGEADDIAEEMDAWTQLWRTQRGQLKDIEQTAIAKSEEFRSLSQSLAGYTQQIEEKANQLILQTNSASKWHNGMEAANRKITATIKEIRTMLLPLANGRQELLQLLERVTLMTNALVESAQMQTGDQELLQHAANATMTRMRLIAALAQCNTAMAPTLATLLRLEETQREIVANLPHLWRTYYLQDRLEWYSPDVWTRYARYTNMLTQAIQIRMPVEIPVTAEQWQSLGKRFAVALLVCAILYFLFVRRFLQEHYSLALRHLCKVSIPVLAVGFCLLFASFEFGGESYRLFLALSNLCIIAGQVLLAWDLRRMSYPDVQQQLSPLFYVIPPTTAAYVLLYLPLLPTHMLVLWLLCVIAALVVRRYRKPMIISPLQIENNILDGEGLILWFCLLLTLAGLHLYSMILYLVFVSTALALQLSIGGMAHISEINEHLPDEGVRAVLASLLVALAAPLLLVVAVVSVLLWGATLPGGMALLTEYAFKSVTIGSTSFNVWHVLLIISLFFLTRATVIMGSRFLSKLPERINFDPTFIPPIQTAFTYAAWAIFVLFVLRSLGVELSNLAVVAGGLSVGIGFGMQAIVSNFVSGLILIFSRMLQAGDVIEVGGLTGRVRKISVRDTMVETYDNAMIYVPNSEFISGRLINWTRNNPIVRGSIQIGVAYGSDTALVKKLLQKIAGEHEAVLKYPAPSAVFKDFGASTLDFSLRFWVKNYDASLGTASDIRMEIDKQFAKHHIEIAFPQMDVHVKELPPRARKNTPHSPRHKRVQRLPKFRRNIPLAQKEHDSSMEDLRENSAN